MSLSDATPGTPVVAEMAADHLPKDDFSFGRHLRDFAVQIHSLYVTLPLTMSAVRAAFAKTYQDYEAFEKENVRYENENGKEVTLVRIDCVQQYDDLVRKLRAYGLPAKAIPCSFLVSLISQYDAFIGRLLRAVYMAKPALLSASERKLTFAQLVEFNGVDAVRDYVLEKEIEAVMRESHITHFDWMEGKFGLPLRKGLAAWPEFVEVTERRNLLVHAGGIVSNQYLSVCREQGVNLADTKAGDELDVSPLYFKRAYNVVFEVGFKLGQVLWRKMLPEEVEAADQNLIDIGFDFALYDRNYRLTQVLFDFATETLRKFSSEETRLIMVVNRALGYKWGGDAARALEIVEEQDWSAVRPKFRLAEAVLRDDFEGAYRIMKDIGANPNEILKEQYRTWPLFRTIRKEAAFAQVFQGIYGEPYNRVDAEAILPPGKNELAPDAA